MDSGSTTSHYPKNLHIFMVVLVGLIMGVVLGFLGHQCPSEPIGAPWIIIFIHNLVFAVTLTIVASRLVVVASILATSVLALTSYTAFRGLLCGVYSSAIVGTLESLAYILAYVVPLLTPRWRIRFTVIVLVAFILAAAAIIEST